MLNARVVNRIAVAAILFGGIAFIFFNLSFLYFLMVVVIWATLTVIGSFHIRWNYHLTSLNRAHSGKEGLVCLSFDDGPHPVFTVQILDLLDRYEAKATFFCIGREMEKYPEVVKEIVSRGHSIGNHSYSHAEGIGFYGDEQMILEIEQCNAVLEGILGRRLRFYRPPFGVTNPNIARALNRTGMQSIGWSLRSMDTTKRSTTQVLHRINSRVQSGDIILLHDNRAGTPDIVEQLLLFLRQRGLSSVTAEQILDVTPYE